MWKNASFIEISFSDEKKNPILVDINTIIIYVYNTNYIPICNPDKLQTNLSQIGSEYPLQIELLTQCFLQEKN